MKLNWSVLLFVLVKVSLWVLGWGLGLDELSATHSYLCHLGDSQNCLDAPQTTPLTTSPAKSERNN